MEDQAISPATHRFHKRFRHCPVVLPCLGPESVQTAGSAAVAAIRAGADGVFLEADGLSGATLRGLTREIRSARPRVWIGLACRCLTDGLIESVSNDLQGLWIRGAGSIAEPQLAQAIDDLREWQEWEGLLFGGLDIGNRDLEDPTAAAVSLSRLVDVVLLETPTLNSLLEVGRVKAVKHGLGNYPVGVAADLGMASVNPLACTVDCIVACPTKAAADLDALIDSVRACHHS